MRVSKTSPHVFFAWLSPQELPAGIYVKLDDVYREFLPPHPCHEHGRAGVSLECPACRRQPGVVVVRPLCRVWKYTDTKTNATFTVNRTQIPLMPEPACSLYSLQGATCDPGLVAHFVMPRRADADIKWLIVYVMLSRVRSLDRLRSVGLTTKIRDIIEGGPPNMLANNFERLFRGKIEETLAAATAALEALGW